ncbi:10046_t:CDS:2 [Dentiscutata erythropus]|uniref:10046_t:CDS:1 n=1 Tax=Dentiscutata erythropus TaxID=1348616 RepID=A0A9N9DUP6_9GLOM|nr:10046_t:CDS:2 [Dentiscutata erythropus]
MPLNLIEYSIPPPTLISFEDDIKEHQAKTIRFLGNALMVMQILEVTKLNIGREAADNVIADARLRYAFVAADLD